FRLPNGRRDRRCECDGMVTGRAARPTDVLTRQQLRWSRFSWVLLLGGGEDAGNGAWRILVHLLTDCACVQLPLDDRGWVGRWFRPRLIVAHGEDGAGLDCEVLDE